MRNVSADAYQNLNVETGTAGPPKSVRCNANFTRPLRRSRDDFAGRWHFNTCVAAIMEFVNELYGAEDEISAGKFPAEVAGSMWNGTLFFCLNPLRLILPVNSGRSIGEKGNLVRHPWPVFDPALAKEDELEYAVQVNGKIRARLSVPADSSEDFVRDHALADEKVKAAIEGKQMVKLIVVPGKLVNIVVK